MTTFEPGDVVVVRFPFTDLAATRTRPAVVLSPPEFGQRYGDVAVMALTRQPQPDEDLAIMGLREAGLLKPTWVKPLVGTLSARLVTRRLGRLNHADAQRVARALRMVIDQRFQAGA